MSDAPLVADATVGRWVRAVPTQWVVAIVVGIVAGTTYFNAADASQRQTAANTASIARVDSIHSAHLAEIERNKASASALAELSVALRAEIAAQADLIRADIATLERRDGVYGDRWSDLAEQVTQLRIELARIGR